MEKKPYRVILEVEVYDEEALRRSAESAATQAGLEDWNETHSGAEDDLHMLLDPGSLPGAGFSIESSSAERVG